MRGQSVLITCRNRATIVAFVQVVLVVPTSVLCRMCIALNVQSQVGFLTSSQLPWVQRRRECDSRDLYILAGRNSCRGCGVEGWCKNECMRKIKQLRITQVIFWLGGICDYWGHDIRYFDAAMNIVRLQEIDAQIRLLWINQREMIKTYKHICTKEERNQIFQNKEHEKNTFQPLNGAQSEMTPTLE